MTQPSDRFIAGLFIFALLLGFAIKAFGHQPYGGWKQPDNQAVSCCDGSDCRPTRAYFGEDGRWRAWDGLGWIIVPPERVLPTDYAGDGRAHLCEKLGHIYCFTPSEPKI